MFVVIDIETGEYEVDQDELAASDRLLARRFDAQMWTRRIVSRYVGFKKRYTTTILTWRIIMQIPTPVDSKLAERLTGLEQSHRDLSNRVDSVMTRIDGLSNRMLTLFCWLVGIQVTTLLTLGTLILFKLE